MTVALAGIADGITSLSSCTGICKTNSGCNQYDWTTKVPPVDTQAVGET